MSSHDDFSRRLGDQLRAGLGRTIATPTRQNGPNVLAQLLERQERRKAALLDEALGVKRDA